MNTQFRPMKGDEADLNALDFPYMASPKLDGHRILLLNGKVLTSQLKPFPNKWLQETFGHLRFDGIDGEVVVGPPTAHDAYSATSKGVRRVEGTPDAFVYAFDYVGEGAALERYERLQEKLLRLLDDNPRLVLHPYQMVNTRADLDVYEAECVKAGFEGVMLRCPQSPYKYGRATVRENYLLKVKRFLDAEASIIGYVEEMTNTNVATTNELGRTSRSKAKDGMVGKNTLGALRVVGTNGQFAGVEFEIGTGFTAALRKEIWNNRVRYMHKLLTYKFQPVGDYTKPRIPVFRRFRND